MYMVLMTLNIVCDTISGRSCLATWKRLPAERPEAVSTAQTGGSEAGYIMRPTLHEWVHAP